MDALIRAVAFATAVELITAMEKEMTARYGGNAASPVQGNEFCAPYGIFLVASLDGRDVACGGLRLIADGTGEVKRMYADPSVRGRGIARAVLRALVAQAREQGLGEVWLETGTKQPEAIGLYESEGFTPITAYGYYRDEPLSRCYGLRL